MLRGAKQRPGTPCTEVPLVSLGSVLNLFSTILPCGAVWARYQDKGPSELGRESKQTGKREHEQTPISEKIPLA